MLGESALPGLIALSYLVVMSALAHKEWRFFVPALAPLALAAGVWGAPWRVSLDGRERALRIALALVAVQSLTVIEWMAGHDLHRRDLGLAARVASQRPDCKALLVIAGGHPGTTRLERTLTVFFEPSWRFDRTLDALDHRWPRSPGRCAVCDRERDPLCVPALGRRGFEPVARVGRAVVLRERSHL